MRVEEVSVDELEELVERLADLRHDLGKYICFETRFVGLDAPVDALRDALRADLEQTRSYRQEDGHQVIEAAWALWARIRPNDLMDDPDIAELDALIGRLQAADLDGDLEALQQTAEAALAVSSVTRRLLDRSRAALARSQGGAYG